MTAPAQPEGQPVMTGTSAGPDSGLAAGGPQALDAGQEIVLAGPGDIEELAGVIADAFFPLDVSRWLVADGAARRGILKEYFAWQLEHAIAEGTVHTTPDRTAAALWIPAGPEPPGPGAGHARRLAEITGRWLDRFVILEAEFGRAHLTGIAHQHLAVLAVCPGSQGQGTGTRLLDFQHAGLDQAATHASLVAASARTRRIYIRHGYTDYGDSISLPGGPESGGPYMYPMVRIPRNGQASPAAEQPGRDEP